MPRMRKCCFWDSGAIGSSRMIAEATDVQARPGMATIWTNMQTIWHLMNHLDLKDATMVGHSTGGGEVVRYIA